MVSLLVWTDVRCFQLVTRLTVLSATAGQTPGERSSTYSRENDLHSSVPFKLQTERDLYNSRKTIPITISHFLKVQGSVQLHPHHGGHAAHQEVRGLLCQAGPEARQSRAQRQENLHGQSRHQPLAGGPRVYV